MNELSMREIIEHSQRVEQESYAFYTEAARIVVSPEVRPLLMDLAAEEIRHFNTLRDLLGQKRLDEKTLAARVAVETDLFDRFVKTHEIAAFATAADVLNIALERENNTEAMYSMLLTMSNIADDIVAVFDNLRLQEVGHASRIRALMDRL